MSSQFQSQIKSVNEAFLAAFARGDAAGMVAIYTEKGQALPPNGAITTGRPAIQSIWQGAIDMGIKGATLETVELEQHGEAAFEVGQYTLQGDGGQVLDEGKYIVIWRQEEGQWRWHRDIWNSSRPA